MRPIDEKKLRDLEATARDIAGLLDRAITQAMVRGDDNERWGFALLLFSFDGPELTWIANAERADMLKVLRELVERFEKGTADEPSRPKGEG